MLCQENVKQFRFTSVRDPVARVLSAYEEVLKPPPWYTTNISNLSYREYDKKNNSNEHFVAFVDDYFMGRMENWDGGMPHHMVSAALTLQAAFEMDRLPNVLGRLEKSALLFKYLHELAPGGNFQLPHAYSTGATKARSTREMVKVIIDLWEEDFVCFGYPLPYANSTTTKVYHNKYASFNRAKRETPPLCSSHYVLTSNEKSERVE